MQLARNFRSFFREDIRITTSKVIDCVIFRKNNDFDSDDLISEEVSDVRSVSLSEDRVGSDLFVVIDESIE